MCWGSFFNFRKDKKMRDFFKKEVLARTYEIFGVRQTDEEKMSDDDIKFLLDGLCQVSKNYSYIPQEDQKNIIRACMLSDKTYRNINLRLVAGWLELNGKKWFTEIAHKETVITHPPVEGEQREHWLEVWKKSLIQMNENFTEASKPKGNGARMREQLDEAGVKFDEEKHKEETIVQKESSSLDDFINKTGDYAEPLEGETETKP